MYIYKPKAVEYMGINLLQGKDICLKFNDLRIIAPQSKVEASFDDLTKEIKNFLVSVYPKANFRDCDCGNITLSINVKSYDITFYTGLWHAQTRYVVKLNNHGVEVDDDFEQINRFFNTLGMKTAKNTLNKCFNSANLQLIEFLNDNLE